MKYLKILLIVLLLGSVIMNHALARINDRYIMHNTKTLMPQTEECIDKALKQ